MGFATARVMKGYLLANKKFGNANIVDVSMDRASQVTVSLEIPSCGDVSVKMLFPIARNQNSWFYVNKLDKSVEKEVKKWLFENIKEETKKYLDGIDLDKKLYSSYFSIRLDPIIYIKEKFGAADPTTDKVTINDLITMFNAENTIAALEYIYHKLIDPLRTMHNMVDSYKGNVSKTTGLDGTNYVIRMTTRSWVYEVIVDLQNLIFSYKIELVNQFEEVTGSLDAEDENFIVKFKSDLDQIIPSADGSFKAFLTELNTRIR